MVVTQSYTLQSGPPHKSSAPQHHTWLLQYYWLYSLCCTLHPCDCFVTANLLLITVYRIQPVRVSQHFKHFAWKSHCSYPKFMTTFSIFLVTTCDSCTSCFTIIQNASPCFQCPSPISYHSSFCRLVWPKASHMLYALVTTEAECSLSIC